MNSLRIIGRIVQMLIFFFVYSISYSQLFDAKLIFEKCSDAVVLIKTPNGIGTGFFINDEGYIITNHHVVQDQYRRTHNAKQITITTKNKSSYSVISVDDTPDFTNLDIAILKVNLLNSNYLSLKPTEAEVGEDVVAIGHPNGDYWNQSKGIISKINLSDSYLLQHDVATDEGNSGGPLINSKGQVTGVVTGYKKMYDNGSNIKVQETGKLATKGSSVKKVLIKRGIKYYENALVVAGMNNYDILYENLKKDKAILISEWETLKKERQKLDEEKLELERKILVSAVTLEKAEEIKKELNKKKNEIEKKWNELLSREREIDSKEQWILKKEKEIKEKLPNRLALEIFANPSYHYNQNENKSYINALGSIGIFYRFGFKRDYSGYPICSDRLGINYGLHKLFGLNGDLMIDGLSHDLSLSIEFSDIFRMGLGKSISNSIPKSEFDYDNFAFILINTTGYPVSFGFNLAYYTDNGFKNKIYSLGMFVGLNLTFLRI